MLKKCSKKPLVKFRQTLLNIAITLTIMSIFFIVLSQWHSGYAWRFDLTISKYVGLSSWSVVMFLVSNVIAAMLAFFALKNSKPLFWHIICLLAFISLIGLSCFPFLMYKPESISCSLHHAFSYSFFVCIMVSFGILFASTKSRKQKIFAASSFLYAGIFILSYIIKTELFFKTIFIWEFLFVVLFLLELKLNTRAISKKDN